MNSALIPWFITLAPPKFSAGDRMAPIAPNIRVAALGSQSNRAPIQLETFRTFDFTIRSVANGKILL